MGSADRSTAYGLEDLPTPTDHPILSTSRLAGPRLKPSQIIWSYSPDEWEEFVFEWAQCLKSIYEDVKRHSGSGDRGLDVVGYLAPAGLLGEWDCFQCKHYAHALRPSDALPELAKVILGVVDGFFVLPRRYRFVAPKGCGPKLKTMLGNREYLKREFSEALESAEYMNHLSAHEVAAIKGVIPDIDFGVFGSEELENLLVLHRKSEYHVWRFGGQLEDRPPSPGAPDDIDLTEMTYVQKLTDVYRERLGDADLDITGIRSDSWCRGHLARQRDSFFSAEALREFSRDKVPQGTYEALESDIHDGVVEIEQADHLTGLDRLNAVISAAGVLIIDENALISVSRPLDRKGICHQLANQHRLNWVRPAE
ncbi:MAG: ABC-three component system protein [Mycobacterium sp.]